MSWSLGQMTDPGGHPESQSLGSPSSSVLVTEGWKSPPVDRVTQSRLLSLIREEGKREKFLG